MSKLTVVHLGVIVFAICLSTQVASENSTVVMPKGNNTMDKGGNYSGPTTVPGTQSNALNSTTTTGAGISLQSGSFSLLLPIAMATPLLHRYC